jgi:hypothetical protein
MNKFLILFAALVCAFQFSNAQTEKGNQTLGLNISVQHTQYSDIFIDNTNVVGATTTTRYTNFTFGPLYSYFIANNVDVGAAFFINTYTASTGGQNIADQSSTGTTKNHNNNYNATLYLRKYFLYANKIGIRTGPYIGYLWANQGYQYTPDQNNNTYSSTGHAYQVGARLEAVYYPSKHLGVSAMLANLNFQHGNNKSVNNGNLEKTNSDSIDFTFVNNLGLSLFYVFGNK